MNRKAADDLDAPIEENAEQRDPDQAQDVAADAIGRLDDPFEDSERAGRSDPASLIPEDMPDLVDTMKQMVTSGRIDNSAFAGEPMHDDEEDSLGVTDEEEDEDI